jgi:D-alanine transfer protein
MHKLIAIFVFPTIAALSFAFIVQRSSVLPEQSFGLPEEKLADAPGIYIDKFDNSSYRESLLFEEGEQDVISIFGSSELSYSGLAAPQQFVPLVSPFKVRTYGHAGNQCLSILCQLLAKENQLNNAKIVFILSPGWFEAKAGLGTSSTVFLEYNSEEMLGAWQNNNSEIAAYARKRIAELFPEFSSPGLVLRNTYFSSRSEVSLAHQMIIKPILLSNKLLKNISVKQVQRNESKKTKHQLNRVSVAIPSWDSLYTQAKQEVKRKSTNNPYGINDEYFNNYIGNKRGKIQAIKNSLNVELQDFIYLMKYVRQKKLNACFVISPLNTLYYKNIENLKPCIEEIERQINGYNGLKAYPLLNLFTDKKEKYEPALLSDVMHLSEYGWYKVDEFIVQNFQKNKRA